MLSLLYFYMYREFINRNNRIYINSFHYNYCVGDSVSHNSWEGRLPAPSVLIFNSKSCGSLWGWGVLWIVCQDNWRISFQGHAVLMVRPSGKLLSLWAALPLLCFGYGLTMLPDPFHVIGDLFHRWQYWEVLWNLQEAGKVLRSLEVGGIKAGAWPHSSLCCLAQYVTPYLDICSHHCCPSCAICHLPWSLSRTELMKVTCPWIFKAVS